MIVSLSLALVAVAALLAFRALLAPAARRHRHAVVWRIWQQSGVREAYSYARARRWPEAALIRPEVVSRDPISGAAVTAEYHALHRRARVALEEER